MGMGEPFLNYQNVIKSINYITKNEGLNFSKKITLSTVGISKMIKFAEADTGVHLAVSLHAASNFKEIKLCQLMKQITWSFTKFIKILL